MAIENISAEIWRLPPSNNCLFPHNVSNFSHSKLKIKEFCHSSELPDRDFSSDKTAKKMQNVEKMQSDCNPGRQEEVLAEMKSCSWEVSVIDWTMLWKHFSQFCKLMNKFQANELK